VRFFNELSRLPRWEATVLALSMAAMAGWFAGKASEADRGGLIAVTPVPADATVLVDNVEVGRSFVMVERPPGPYTVSVTRDGYMRHDEVVEVQRGRTTTLAVKLEASADTGFELTSEPPGQPVWLDGTPVMTAESWQTRTNFRASRIAPGHHVLEIRGEGFKVWMMDIEIEPGAIRKVHATLVPVLSRAEKLVSPRRPTN
jgi:hypothetical protein